MSTRIPSGSRRVAILARQPQEVQFASVEIVEQVLQTAAARPPDQEPRSARCVGGCLAHRVDGQLGQLIQLLAAVAEDIGAAHENAVVIRWRGRIPWHRLDRERRRAMDV